MPTGTEPKLTVVAERLAVGLTPVPVRLTVWGLPAALSVTLRVPLAVPLAVGVKLTLIVQLAPAATLVPQVFVWANPDPAVTLTLVMVRVVAPELTRVAVWGALVVPTN